MNLNNGRGEMTKLKVKRPLTKEEKKKIRGTIIRKMTPEDRDPDEVIKTDYGGNEDEYYWVMACCLGISLD